VEGCTPDFFVIRLVTLLEVFTRQNIGGLIDHQRQFADRAIELSRNLRIDFALVRDVQGRAVTLGDIVAHNVSVNSFGQIMGYFETLLGKALRPVLSQTVDRWESEVERKPPQPIISDFDRVATQLSRLFEIRHILCHEMPRKPVYGTSEIDEFFEASIQFSKALEDVLGFEKYGKVPLTQSEMNSEAHKSLKAAEEELEKIATDIRAYLKGVDETTNLPDFLKGKSNWQETFEDAQVKWKLFRDAQCEFDTYLSRGGTINPLLWATEAERQTVERTSELRTWFEREQDA
jgi:uncharacterized protein YecT (DUF1311 family)